MIASRPLMVAGTACVLQQCAPHRGGERVGEDHVDRHAVGPRGAGRDRLDLGPRPAPMREDEQVEV